MEILYRSKRSVSVLRIRGSLNREGIIQLKSILSIMLEKKWISIVLNLEGVEKIDPRRLKILVNQANQSRKLGGDLKVSNLNTDIRKSFKSIKMKGRLDILPTEEIAVQSFHNNSKSVFSSFKIAEFDTEKLLQN